jgi:hypothetical protein
VAPWGVVYVAVGSRISSTGVTSLLACGAPSVPLTTSTWLSAELGNDLPVGIVTCA